MTVDIDQAAARARMDQILAQLAATPIEVLEEAKRRQDIEAHNAKVDAAKAAKAKRKAQREMVTSVLSGLKLANGHEYSVYQ